MWLFWCPTSTWRLPITSSFGFTVLPGGAHADGLTENALIAFADGSYLELIAFNDPGTPQLHRWWRYVGAGGGLIDYALGCPALQTHLDALADKQLVFDGPHANGRQRLDGTHCAGWAPSPLQAAGSLF